MIDMNDKQKTFSYISAGIMVGFLIMFTATGLLEHGKVLTYDDCWFVLASKNGIDSTVHVWNFTENDSVASCTKLKDLCYTIQINHMNGHLNYNCRWLFSNNIYGNNSCVCSYDNLPGILNVTRVEEVGT